jgi:hypothetical protein
MALQMATYLSGKVENVVYYKRSGTYIARTIAENVKQSIATKIRSRNFGIASSAGSALRSLLLPVLPFPKDRKMQNKFAGAIARWLGLNNISDLLPTDSLPYVNHFDFNESTSIKERFKIPIDVTKPSANLIEVNIPAFIPTLCIAAPAHTESVELTVTVASCDLQNGVALGSFTSKINIPYNDTLVNARAISLGVPTDAGSLVITALSLSYLLAGEKKNSNAAFMPASVVDVRYY